MFSNSMIPKKQSTTRNTWALHQEVRINLRYQKVNFKRPGFDSDTSYFMNTSQGLILSDLSVFMPVKSQNNCDCWFKLTTTTSLDNFLVWALKSLKYHKSPNINFNFQLILWLTYVEVIWKRSLNCLQMPSRLSVLILKFWDWNDFNLLFVCFGCVPQFVAS